MRPHRGQPTRPPPPLGFSGQEHWSGLPFPSPKHESESEVAQSCLTLHDPTDPMDGGSSIHGIFQARVLEWGAIAFSTSSSYKGTNPIMRARSSWPHLTISQIRLIISLLAHGLRSCILQVAEQGLVSCGTGVQLPWSMWGRPRQGIKLVPLVLQGGLSTTGPPGKLCFLFCNAKRGVWKSWMTWGTLVLVP